MTKIINVYYISSTWELEDDTFYCSHDNAEVEDYVQDAFGPDGYYQVDYKGYVCSECGEPLEGDPDHDKQDLIAEAQLMDLLGK